MIIIMNKIFKKKYTIEKEIIQIKNDFFIFKL